MTRYIYQYRDDSVALNLSGSTGLTPLDITAAYGDEIWIDFASPLDAKSKASLDEFMASKSYYFNRAEEI